MKVLVIAILVIDVFIFIDLELILRELREK